MVRRSSVKKKLKNLKNSQEKTCAKVFFNRVAELQLLTFWQWLFPVNFATVLRTPFYRKAVEAASDRTTERKRDESNKIFLFKTICDVKRNMTVISN